MDLNLGDTQLILKECRRQKALRNQAAYILATAKWETNHKIKPVVEAYWLSERWRSQNLRYYPWHGRGYVQLTWQRNYIFAGKKLDMDLISDPDVVMKPKVAAKILVQGSMEGWFTGKKIPDYITLTKSDFKGARRVINGTDKAKEIADIAKQYDKALKEYGYGGEEPEVEKAIPSKELPEKSPKEKPSVLKMIVAFLQNLKRK